MPPADLDRVWTTPRTSCEALWVMGCVYYASVSMARDQAHGLTDGATRGNQAPTTTSMTQGGAAPRVTRWSMFCSASDVQLTPLITRCEKTSLQLSYAGQGECCRAYH
jgi:hypothetical protein